MALIHQPDFDLLLRWLEQLGVPHYLCGQCQGIHISELQSIDGVLESRLFLDQGCLIFTTEVEISPSMLFAVQADLHHINGALAHVKAFLDVQDEEPARLILCDTVWLTAGLTRDQFQVFIENLLPVKVELLQDLSQRGYIQRPEGESGEGESFSGQLH